MQIRGIPIILYETVETGTDAFNRPVYEQREVTVENVLVSPLTAEEATDAMNLTGRRAVYQLCLPKGDNHDWANKTVSFFGKDWRTIGEVEEWIEAMVPLSWNKKVKVERINGEGSED